MTPSTESRPTPAPWQPPTAAGTPLDAPQVLAALAPAKHGIEARLQSVWSRLLVPSYSDLFFLAMVAWLCIGPTGNGWANLLADGDAGWHIRTGDFILDHKSVPYQDLFSFSKPGAPWFAWEWLSDVLDALLFRWAGLKGVVLCAGMVLALYATTLMRRMNWRGVHILLGLMVSLFCIGSASIHFLARPHMFTLLLLSVSMWMIEADRVRPSWHIWLLAPLTVVWTNLHGGFLALIAVLGLTAVGTALEVWLGNGRTLRDVLRYFQLTAVCALASLVNPYGWNLHLHVAEYLRSDWIRAAVQEFQSPSFRGETMFQFEGLLLIGVMVAAALFRRKQVVEGLWIVFWAHMALASVRHVPIFVTVAGPAIASELGSWWSLWTVKAKKSSVVGIFNQMAAETASGFSRTSLLPWLVVAGLIVTGEPIHWPKDFPDQVFPTKIVHDNLELISHSRIFTTDQWADYLIFTNPQQKVFTDGRSDFYGPEIGKDYLRFSGGHWSWRELLAKYDFNLVLLTPSDAIVQLLKQEPGWRVVVDDGKQILLARR